MLSFSAIAVEHSVFAVGHVQKCLIREHGRALLCLAALSCVVDACRYKCVAGTHVARPRSSWGVGGHLVIISALMLKVEWEVEQCLAG